MGHLCCVDDWTMGGVQVWGDASDWLRAVAYHEKSRSGAPAGGSEFRVRFISFWMLYIQRPVFSSVCALVWTGAAQCHADRRMKEEMYDSSDFVGYAKYRQYRLE